MQILELKQMPSQKDVFNKHVSFVVRKIWI